MANQPDGNLRLIELAGSPWQIGRRHGEGLAQDIRAMRRALLAYLFKAGLALGTLPLLGLLMFLARRFWPFIPRHLQEEMTGLASGAQVSLATILLFNVLDDLANIPQCSGLAAGGPLTEDGAYLAGRNLDYPLFIDILIRLQTLFVVEPLRGQPFASLAWPGYIGVCTGMNRGGLVMGQFASKSRDTTFQGMPAALRFRQALESADSVSSAADAILGVKGTIGNNLLLVSADEALVLELSAHQGAVRTPEDGLLTVTNHYQSPAMVPWQGRFPRRPPFSPLSAVYFTEAYSRARDARLKALAKGKILKPEDLQEILADEHIANPGTVVSVVFRPGDRSLWVARGSKAPVCRGPFQKIPLWQ